VEAFREVDLALSDGARAGMPRGDGVDLLAQPVLEGGRQEGGSVFGAFASSDDDLVPFEVDVFDAQGEALEEPQATSVEEIGDEAKGGFHLFQELANLFAREDFGQVGGSFGAFEPMNVDLEDFFVQEEDSAQRLVLSGGGGASFIREVIEEGCDFGSSHPPRVSPAMKADELEDPMHVGLLGPRGVVHPPQCEPNGLRQHHG
jgi:hypothetical protein